MTSDNASLISFLHNTVSCFTLKNAMTIRHFILKYLRIFTSSDDKTTKLRLKHRQRRVHISQKPSHLTKFCRNSPKDGIPLSHFFTCVRT